MSNGWLADFINAPRFQAEISARQRGTTRKRISKKNLCLIHLPVPPAGEQHRIADALDSYLSRLDAAEAALKRVQANLERYRASVLKAAVEGRLVPTEAELAREEGREYEPAEVLLERILIERRARWEEAELAKLEAKGKLPKDDRWKQKYKEPVAPDLGGLPELPEGWCWASTDQVTQMITSGPRDWTDYYGAGDATFLMAQNVRPSRLDLSYRQAIDPPAGNPSTTRARVECDDVLVTIVGANTGNLCRVPIELTDHFVCQSVALMRPVRSQHSRLMEMWFNSPPGLAIYTRYAYGQGRPHLGFEHLREAALPIMPVGEQLRIERAIDSQLSVAEEIGNEVSIDLARVARLRQSILAAAFEGKLVEQDPADERASELLARIAAEREPSESRAKVAKRSARNRKVTA